MWTVSSVPVRVWKFCTLPLSLRMRTVECAVCERWLGLLRNVRVHALDSATHSTITIQTTFVAAALRVAAGLCNVESAKHLDPAQVLVG